MGPLELMAKEKSESDVRSDDHVAGSQDTGGVDNPAAPDQASTTGPTPTPEYVGRIAGDESGDTSESGTERRAEQERKPD